jgi:hypothetical protein
MCHLMRDLRTCLWALLMLLLLHGCYAISDPDIWPRDFVQQDTLPTLVGMRESDVVERLGVPKVVVKTHDHVSYLYEHIDQDTGVDVAVYIPFHVYKAWEVRCVLLEFDEDGILRGYKLESGGAVRSGWGSGFFDCTNLFRFDLSEQQLVDPRIHIAIGADYGVAEQYAWYLSRPPNDPDRLPYLCRAADGGHPNAQIEVGRHYSQGVDGVTKDLKRAYVWYSLAQGAFGRGVHLQLIAKEMTPEQIAEAEQMLTDWKPGQCERDLLGARESRDAE